MDPQLIDPSGRVVDSWSTTEGAKPQCQVAVVTQRLQSPVAPLASPPSPSVLVERSWSDVPVSAWGYRQGIVSYLMPWSSADPCACGS